MYTACLNLLYLNITYTTDMAKLKGPLKIEGTLDKLSFYETQDGIIVRRKWGPDRKRMNNDKAFDAARAHGQEFGAAAKHSRLLRNALLPFLKHTADNRVTGRVNKLLLTITKMDTVSARGERSLAKGLAHTDADALLNGFEFNINCQLKDHLFKLPAMKKKKEQLYLEGTLSKKDIHYPVGSTHAKLKAGWLRIDFENKKFDLAESDSVIIDRKTKNPEIRLKLLAPIETKGSDLFVLKLIFFKKINGVEQAMENIFNCCALFTGNL